MEEHKNRFIIFPDVDVAEHTESTSSTIQESEGTVDTVVPSTSIDSFQKTLDSSFVSSPTTLVENGEFTNFEQNQKESVTEIPSTSLEKDQEMGNFSVEDGTLETTNFASSDSSSNLGELGIVQKDEKGRVIFDTPLEETSTVLASEEDMEPNFPSVDTASTTPPTPIVIEDEPEVQGSKENAFQTSKNLQDMINKILKIDDLQPVEVDIAGRRSEELEEQSKREQEKNEQQQRDIQFRKEIYNVVQADEKAVVFKSDLLDKLKDYSEKSGKFSVLVRYGEDYCSKDFVTNPAIGREEEIKQLILTLLTPEKSAILIGKPGIGKTSIVEGLAYRLERNDVPEALQGFAIINVKTPSLIGTLPNGETRLQSLVDELKTLDHVILFIDEIHMLIGATNDSAMDFANMFKEGLGRGQIKIIGATTTEEYERYILRDKAFVRRFQSIEVLEPSREHTIKILMGTLPKIEKETGAKLKYTTFIQSEIMAFITDITSEYKRVYGIGSRYPDICLTLLKEAFSQCIFDNRDRVTIFDVRDAIENSKNIYPDVIRKELPKFDEKFKKIIDEEIAEENSIDHL